MAADSSLQTNNIPWQLRQMGKNLSEWIQLQLSRGGEESPSPLPSFEFPVWIGQLFFWAVVLGAVVWLAWLIVQVLDRYFERRRTQPRSQPQVKTLLSPTEHSVGEWLRRAKQFEREGNWREACRALYLAALQLLHDRQWVPHQASRTDGEYLAAIQALQQPRPWQLLIRTHERSLFGADPLSADHLKRCRLAYEELEQR
ncbi:MAG TPA: DUF4129 domain-containing protein [Candidatus Obscuribacterales bacterium]